MSCYSEQYVDQGHALTNEVKIDEDPMPISFLMVKREPEERNFLDHHVTGIKEEYEDQSSDLLSEIKCEEDPVPISFPMVKLEQEEEQSDSDAVKEDPGVEVTPEDNEVLTERVFLYEKFIVTPGCW
ncbi:chromo domain-containing protein cec-1-like isoform X2 [Periplaneta americana]|uniref:chromo domain-containing protein cec-1-like isoform X2 n=1 Tax=Periplaneta americana TaxID=6978 RepID=UPI0037E7C1CE